MSPGLRKTIASCCRSEHRAMLSVFTALLPGDGTRYAGDQQATADYYVAGDVFHPKFGDVFVGVYVTMKGACILA